jgi:uncharacterized protein YecT (DUF1311 family)
VVKRDYIAEILAARARGRGHELIAQVRLRSLVAKAAEATAPSYRDYFPVAAIAALESVFRAAVRDLVDAGPPYSARAGTVVHDVRVEVAALHAFHGQKISVGEFVAHLVPFKSFEDIIKALTTLLDAPFMSAIKAVEDPWLKRAGRQEHVRVLPRHGPLFEDVKALIGLRHLLAHEVPTPSPVTDMVVLQRQLASTERFAAAISEVVAQTLHPDAPLTQLEMNQAAGKEAAEADEAMEQIYTEGLSTLAGAELQAFEASQGAFLDYRAKTVEYAGSRFAGGSIRPMVEALEHAQLTRQRTDDLRRLLKSWEEAPDEP